MTVCALLLLCRKELVTFIRRLCYRSQRRVFAHLWNTGRRCYSRLHTSTIRTLTLVPSCSHPRWNPHRSPSLAPLDTGALSSRGEGVRTLGQVSLPRSSGLSLGQVNYLMVDYSLGELPTERRSGGGGERVGTREDFRSGARLSVFVNDPGRSGSAPLSVKLDLWTHIEMGG